VQFTYVLKGWVKMQYEGEMLEVTAPQRFRTYDAKVR
jgi:hypothetical protein